MGAGINGTRKAVAALGLVLMLVAGCESSPPSRFYTLKGIAAPLDDEVKAKRAAAVVVGAVSLPKYLDRPQVVSRPGDYVVELAEFDRWAEPLDEMVPRVIAENLTALLASDQVFMGTRARVPGRAYEVEITFYRFDVADGKEAKLVAHWDILDREKDRVVTTQQSAISVPVAAGGYESQAAALSEALGRLCREIAESLRGGAS